MACLDEARAVAIAHDGSACPDCSSLCKSGRSKSSTIIFPLPVELMRMLRDSEKRA
jgi:hypothetical protein